MLSKSQVLIKSNGSTNSLPAFKGDAILFVISQSKDPNLSKMPAIRSLEHMPNSRSSSNFCQVFFLPMSFSNSIKSDSNSLR